MTYVATISPTGGGFVDKDIANGAQISASKLIHHQLIHAQLAENSTAVAAVTELLFTANQNGTLLTFEAFIVTQATGADRTVTVDLQKSTGGGAFSTILTSTIDIDNTTVVRTPIAATFSDTGVIDGDHFKTVVTVAGSAGDQAEGLCATLALDLYYPA